MVLDRCMLLNALLVCLTLGMAGCGGKSDRQPTTPVSGIVTFEGKPVPQGTVMFLPVVPGPPGQANLKPDGTFVAGTYEVSDGLIPGEYTITVVGQMEIDPPTTETPLAENAGKTKAPQQIPDQFGSSKTSGLTASIKKGEKHDLKFELKK